MTRDMDMAIPVTLIFVLGSFRTTEAIYWLLYNLYNVDINPTNCGGTNTRRALELHCMLDLLTLKSVWLPGICSSAS
jgi:hypothetical protein